MRGRNRWIRAHCRAEATLSGRGAAQDVGGAVDGGVVAVEVQHEPDPPRTDLRHQHALGLRCLGDHWRVDVVQHHHVGLDGRRVHPEPLGQQLGVLVVLTEPGRWWSSA